MQYPFRQFIRWWMDDDLWSFINHFVATKCDLHMTLFELYYWQFIADVRTRPGAFYYLQPPPPPPHYRQWAIKYSLPGDKCQ